VKSAFADVSITAVVTAFSDTAPVHLGPPRDESDLCLARALPSLHPET
jgi:hypothetical protein